MALTLAVISGKKRGDRDTLLTRPERAPTAVVVLVPVVRTGRCVLAAPRVPSALRAALALARRTPAVVTRPRARFACAQSG